VWGPLPQEAQAAFRRDIEERRILGRLVELAGPNGEAREEAEELASEMWVLLREALDDQRDAVWRRVGLFLIDHGHQALWATICRAHNDGEWTESGMDNLGSIEPGSELEWLWGDRWRDEAAVRGLAVPPPQRPD
jgi:hypothetical protein